MDQYFSRIKHFAGITELPSRIRFMLQDVIELRDNKVSHVTHHFSVVLLVYPSTAHYLSPFEIK